VGHEDHTKGRRAEDSPRLVGQKKREGGKKKKEGNLLIRSTGVGTQCKKVSRNENYKKTGEMLSSKPSRTAYKTTTKRKEKGEKMKNS